ncbi:MAG TPA: type IV toxin-antitoxin system AbiEi family antitoxin [Pirellulales bacterium]|nr:type IV toxin-antitoxin system AbiEi family antitoxin [Pirellulales bacterium]
MGTVSTQTEQKIKSFLAWHKPGTVCLAAWLEKSGISRDLQKRYRRSGWLESVGAGAFKRAGDDVGWQGGLYALQAQAGLPLHAGAMTALGMQGLAHYFRLGEQTVFLFSPPRTPLPAWFRRHDWQVQIRHAPTSILPGGLGLTDHEERTFSIKISAPERAMLECLYLAPAEADLAECFQVMEGLVNLRPRVVQQLLAVCTSVKSKRLFLYLAEKAGHHWLRRVDPSRLDLGTGSRSLVKGGAYVSKYQLVVPEALATL